MENYKFIQVSSENYEKALEMFCQIFDRDEYFNLILRSDERRRWAIKKYFDMIMKISIKTGGITVSDNFQGGCIFLDPSYTDAAKGMQMVRLISGLLRCFSIKKSINSFKILFDVIKEQPKFPHYYFFAVGQLNRPGLGGKGVAAGSVQTYLEKCDSVGLPCYAELSSRQSAKWAEHFGFEIQKIEKYNGMEIFFAPRQPRSRSMSS